VNEPSEATHYQIELTSRQVLTALAVLLTCLFAAFFAGVWIGRSAAADAAALELARVDEIARADERFDFFSRTDAAQPEGSPPERQGSSARDRAALEPERADQEEELEPVDPDTLFEDPQAPSAGDELPPPEEMGRGGRRRRDAARAAAAEAPPEGAGDESEAVEPPPAAPAVQEPAAAAQAPAAAPAAAQAASGFHIQVLATSDRQKAEALIDRLVDADFKAFLVPSSEGGRTVYRVRVGPFPDRALATRQAAELENRWGLDSWISPGAP
jgi:cell division septation protein DedD